MIITLNSAEPADRDLIALVLSASLADTSTGAAGAAPVVQVQEEKAPVAEKAPRKAKAKEATPAAQVDAPAEPTKGEVVTEAKNAEPAKVDLFGEEPAAAPITKEQVRNALSAYAEKHGAEKAREVMRNAGKAETLSAIQPSFYPAVMAALA